MSNSLRDEVELLPCPFCGSAAKSGFEGSGDEGYCYIACPQCNGGSGRPFIGVDGDDAAELPAIWNRRHPPADGVVVDADIAALRASEPKGMRRLRWLLAMRFSGRNLYRDDGEYSDTSTQPFIDFRRDSVPEIERKMRDRDMQRAKDQADAILAQRE